ncbi:hypothetical protein ACS0TY_010886 [Phlomoides rotata]
MPPSPAMRISPGRELKADNHKRGRSLESGILFREKDDDLALFNDVQNKEKEKFLLQSNDDFDDIFSTKLKHFSDNKLGISVPARGESSDLLNAEGDKNDYDWLITPPETPLFRSLDDEAPPVSLAPRGRPRSQPVTISRSSTMEKGYRSGRGSASPHRLSPSPRSGNSILQSRSSPFSAIHSSPPPTLRNAPPSRRLSPPPSKSTPGRRSNTPTPGSRSNTPTPRRMSTGSAGAAATSRVRGASPIKTSMGNSASPKIRAWQSNMPVFSLEAPPNLRTTLADRPASYVRGSSPASGSGSRSGRQSMSPTASRSVNSSHSRERDQFSSHSKGSVASSGDDDDDVDSLQSYTVSSSDRSVPRSLGSFPNNRAMGFSKKPTKILSSSVPKRSFDLTLRQLERKGPQNMFRPLLSSVPSSTFYAGKVNAHHRALMSRNSSITTSSNASSDQGTSGALDTEESEQYQEDLTSDFVKRQYPSGHDEVFVMDQVDASNEAVENRTIEEPPNRRDGENNCPCAAISQCSSQFDTAADMDSADGIPYLEVCSRCSRRFNSFELVREGDLWFCLECKGSEINSMTIVGDSVQILECGSLEVFDRAVSIPESLQLTGAGGTGFDPLDTTANEGQRSYSEPSRHLAVLLNDKRELNFATEEEIFQSVDGDTGNHLLQQCGVDSTSKVDASEGTGISLLLQSSSSSKGRIVQSRSFTASTICYNDFSNARESVNSTRSSIGHSSVSVSSSVDLGSSMQTETRIHRQSNGWKYDMENYRFEIPIKHKRSNSSLSGASGYVSQVASIAPSCAGDGFKIISANKAKEVSEVICADPLEQSLASECTEAESTCTDVESSIIFKTGAELSSHLMNVRSGDTSMVSILTPEESASHGINEKLTYKSNNSTSEETSAAHFQTSSQGEDVMQSSFAERIDVVEALLPSSLDYASEMEIKNADIVSTESQSDVDSTNSKTFSNELLDPSVSASYNEVAAVEEFDVPVPLYCVLEESTVVLEDLGGTKSRSLTLEEATDAILFCSSIVHNLAYEAANIAVDKENPPLEVLRPTLAFVGKTNSDRRDIRLRTLGKRSSKSQKARQRKLEMDTKPPPVIAETNEKPTAHIVRSPSKGDSMNPPKLESKCNCTIM